jgi:hypothetical protein
MAFASVKNRLLLLAKVQQLHASTAQSLVVLNVKPKAPVGTVGLVSRYPKENVPVQRRRLSLGQVGLLTVRTAQSMDVRNVRVNQLAGIVAQTFA